MLRFSSRNHLHTKHYLLTKGRRCGGNITCLITPSVTLYYFRMQCDGRREAMCSWWWAATCAGHGAAVSRTRTRTRTSWLFNKTFRKQHYRVWVTLSNGKTSFSEMTVLLAGVLFYFNRNNVILAGGMSIYRILKTHSHKTPNWTVLCWEWRLASVLCVSDACVLSSPSRL